MIFKEVLDDLTRKKSPEVCLCLHPAHPAVLELIGREDYFKWQDKEPGYIQLRTLPDRGAALELTQQALLYAWERDPSMKNVKALVREFFAQERTGSEPAAQGKEKNQ